MASNQKNHEIGTLLRLVAPEAVEVELVPLSSIEKAEFLFFWSAIFLTVWGTVLGTWLSLISVRYDNEPVIKILLAVLIFLSILVLAFTYSGFRVRSVTRQSARRDGPRTLTPPVSGRMDRVISSFLEMLKSEFTETDFKNLVNTFDDSENDVVLQRVLFDHMIASGAAVAVDANTKPIFYRKNPELVAVDEARYP